MSDTPELTESQSIASTELTEISLTDSEFLMLAKIAHEQDITFNQLINKILREVVDAHLKENLVE